MSDDSVLACDWCGSVSSVLEFVTDGGYHCGNCGTYSDGSVLRIPRHGRRQIWVTSGDGGIERVDLKVPDPARPQDLSFETGPDVGELAAAGVGSDEHLVRMVGRHYPSENRWRLDAYNDGWVEELDRMIAFGETLSKRMGFRSDLRDQFVNTLIETLGDYRGELFSFRGGGGEPDPEADPEAEAEAEPPPVSLDVDTLAQKARRATASILGVSASDVILRRRPPGGDKRTVIDVEHGSLVWSYAEDEDFTSAEMVRRANVAQGSSAALTDQSERWRIENAITVSVGRVLGRTRLSFDETTNALREVLLEYRQARGSEELVEGIQSTFNLDWLREAFQSIVTQYFPDTPLTVDTLNRISEDMIACVLSEQRHTRFGPVSVDDTEIIYAASSKVIRDQCPERSAYRVSSFAQKICESYQYDKGLRLLGSS